MIVIPPVDCTASGVLVSSNAVNLAVYAAGTAYDFGASVSYSGRNWTSLQAANTGNTPGSSPLWWDDAGPVNTLAMFDTSVSTTTTRTGGLTWRLAPGRITAVGLMGLVGQALTLTVYDGATAIFTKTQALASSDGTYFGFCFEPFTQTGEAAFYGLPSTPTMQVEISITGAGETACGLCVVGKQFDIGNAQYGFSVPLEDRGRHYLDKLGNPVNLERGYSKGVSGTLITDISNFNRLTRFFGEHIGVPLFWVAAPDQADLVTATTFGRFIRAVPVIAGPNHITSSIEIAGYR